MKLDAPAVFRLLAATVLACLVLGIVVTLQYRSAVERSREAVLRENLRRTREAIIAYKQSHGVCPSGLEVLVSDGFLRSFPYDPITDSDSLWIMEYSSTHQGACAIYSGAEGEGLDGTPYLTW